MDKRNERVLGSEYIEVVEKELSKLSESSRMLLGGVCAIVQKNDENLGRTEIAIENNEIKKYIIFTPSKYSIICNLQFETVRNTGSEYTLISLNELVNKLVRLDITAMQLIIKSNIIYSTSVYDEVVTKFKELNKQSDYVDLATCTMVSAMLSMKNQIDKSKNKSKDFVATSNAMKDKAFMIYKLYESVKNRKTHLYENLQFSNIYKDIQLEWNDNRGTERLQSLIEEVLDIESKLTTEFNFQSKSKRNEKFTAIHYDLMKNIIKNILLIEE